MMGTADIGSVAMGCVRSPAVTSDEFSRWSQIAAYLPGRTDAQIENHWHSCLKKRAVVANQRHSEAPTMTLDQIATDDVDMDQHLQIDLYDLFTDSGAGFFESGLGK